MKPSLLPFLAFVSLFLAPVAPLRADDPAPPPGFRALFDGKDRMG
jgi:hypothetical protein